MEVDELLLRQAHDQLKRAAKIFPGEYDCMRAQSAERTCRQLHALLEHQRRLHPAPPAVPVPTVQP